MNPLSKTVTVRHESVDEESAGQRIDNFLLRVCKGVPKSLIYRILRSGEVRVNGGRIGPAYKLQNGDQVRIPPLRVAVGPVAGDIPAGRPLPVVFEDEHLLVVDKPAGLAVHGGSGVSFGVIEQLRRQRPEARFLELAHRIDRETSGLLVIAKRRAALTALHDMLRDGKVEKRYLALVRGRWMNPVQHLKAALLKYLTAEGDWRVRVCREGKAAHSIARLVRRWQTGSLVEVELKTGRTHQIRVHLSHQGFPLWGDEKYGDFAFNKELARRGLARMFLHAARLRFRHPITGTEISLESPLPADLEPYLSYLDQNEGRDHG